MNRRTKNKLTLAALMAVPAFVVTEAAHATTFTFTNTDNNNSWLDTNNWSPTGAPITTADTANFGGTFTDTDNRISIGGSNISLLSLNITNTAFGFNIGSTAGDTITFASTGGQIAATNSTQVSSQTISANLVLGGTIFSITNQVGTGATLYFNGIISGTSTISLSDANQKGLFAFDSQSTFSGGVIMPNGQVNQIGASATYSGVTLISGALGTGTIAVNNNPVFVPLNGDQVLGNHLLLNTGVQFGIASTANSPPNEHNFTVSGPIDFTSTASRTISVTMPGETMSFGLASMPSTFTLSTTGAINQAFVVPLGSTMAINDVIQDNASAPATPDTVSYINLSSGATGAGTVVFNSQNTYAGATTLSGSNGVYQFKVSSVPSGTGVASGPFGTGTVIFNTNANTPSVLIPEGGSRTIGNALTLTRGFFVLNDASGVNDFSLTGPITLGANAVTITNNMSNGATLTLGSATAASTLALGTSAGELLTIQSQTGLTGVFGNTVVNDNITDATGGGAGSLLAQVGGIVVLNGVNTFTGGLTVSNGATVSVSQDANMGSSTGSVSIVGTSGATPSTLLATGTFSSARPINLSPGTNTSGDVLDVTTGNTLALTGTLSVTGDLNKGTSGGTLQLAQAGYSGTGNVNVGGGALIFGGISNFTNTPNGPVVSGGGLSGPVSIGGALTINAGAKAALNPSVPGTGQNNSVGSLSIGNRGVLDIGNHTVIVQNAPDETVVGKYLANGYAGGFWNGTSPTGGAINSVVAFNDNSGSTSVGYGNSSDFTFGGSTSPYRVGGPKALTGNQVVVAPALAGDLLLSGTVGPNELALMLGAFGTTGNDWAFGNIDYDAAGLVGPNDLSLLLSNFGHSSAGFASAKSASKSLTSTAKPSLVASGSDVAAPPADGIELIINVGNGDAQIEGNGATLVTSIVLTSNLNSLVGGTTFTPAFTALFNTSASNTNGLIDEFNTFTNGSAVNGLVDMANVYNTVQNSEDVLFQFSEKGVNRGSLQTGSVFYVGVPEPTTLGLVGFAAAGLLGRRRKRR